MYSVYRLISGIFRVIGWVMTLSLPCTLLYLFWYYLMNDKGVRNESEILDLGIPVLIITAIGLTINFGLLYLERILFPEESVLRVNKDVKEWQEEILRVKKDNPDIDSKELKEKTELAIWDPRFPQQIVFRDLYKNNKEIES